MANKLDIDPDLVRKLADLLVETGLSEIEYENAGRRIRVARPPGAQPILSSAHFATPPLTGSQAQEITDQNPETEKRTGTAITSPMVGTVFLAPEPGAAPFIQLGDNITEGQTVMLIEAMKTYNPVRATKTGKVLRILVNDATPVEFGEELLLIE